MLLFIENNFDFHYEIIESVINKYDFIIKQPKNMNDIIVLKIKKNDSFEKYIKSKYKNIIISNNLIKFDFYINCTIYDKDFSLINHSNNFYYIAHEITPKLLALKNIYFLTPLCNNDRFLYADILPFSNNKIHSKIPIYIIQGNITDKRRNYELLDKILEIQSSYDFRIKIIGRGKMADKYLKHKKIIHKNNLDFENFHKEFLDGYCILPLISKNTHKQYYTNKLTSSINYGKAYKLKFIIDSNLQAIYKLDNVEIYDTDIVSAFVKSLNDFYSLADAYTPKGLQKNCIK